MQDRLQARSTMIGSGSIAVTHNEKVNGWLQNDGPSIHIAAWGNLEAFTPHDRKSAGLSDVCTYIH